MPSPLKTCFPAALAAVTIFQSSTHAQLFESDSKRYPSSKMDIVVREIERRPRSSVVEIKIRSIGSSVGSSFFILCSIRQLARLRGAYRYVVKLEETPKPGQMLVGFVREPEEPLANIDKQFEKLNPRDTIIELEQFAEICDSMK